jgi:hypothetical protein
MQNASSILPICIIIILTAVIGVCVPAIEAVRKLDVLAAERTAKPM